MENISCLIKIKNQQKDGADEAQFVECFLGKVFIKSSETFIYYKENSKASDETVNACIKIAENCVTVTRKGAYNSKIVYCVGAEDKLLYNTPYGNIPMTIKTKEVHVNKDELGIVIKLHYFIQINNDISENDMKINIEYKNN